MPLSAPVWIMVAGPAACIFQPNNCEKKFAVLPASRHPISKCTTGCPMISPSIKVDFCLHRFRYLNSHHAEDAGEFAVDDGDGREEKILSALVRFLQNGIVVVERIKLLG